MSLNPTNAITNQKLCAAMGALHTLDQAGATVLDVRVTTRNTRIVIDPRHATLPGAMRVRRPQNGATRVVMTARIGDAQVEWEERHDAR